MSITSKDGEAAQNRLVSASEGAGGSRGQERDKICVFFEALTLTRSIFASFISHVSEKQSNALISCYTMKADVFNGNFKCEKLCRHWDFNLGPSDPVSLHHSHNQQHSCLLVKILV